MRIGMVLPKFNRKSYLYYSLPVGLAYIKGALKKQGYEVDVINLNHKWGDLNNELYTWLRSNEFDVVMTGGLSAHLSQIRQIFCVIKDFNNKIITIGGGGGFSSEPIISSEITGCDIACLGEGELTIPELITKLDKGDDISEVCGIIWKNGGEYIINPSRPIIKELDTIPFPDYDGFEVETYFSYLTPADGYFLYTHDNPRDFPIYLGRSCPFNCTFCYHPLGNKYRQRSLDNFFQELDLRLDQYHINSIGINDELFFAQKEKIVEFCKRIKDYRLTWNMQLRVNLVDKEILEIMHDAGCNSISYGIERINSDVLKSMNKKITKNDIENALKMTLGSGITIQGNFIFGDTDETAQTANETIDWWRKHRDYQLNLGLIQLYPGTQLYKDAVKNGRISNPKKFVECGYPFINVSKLSDSSYEKFKHIHMMEEMREEVEKGKVEYIGRDDDEFAYIKLVCPCCGQINEFHRIRLRELYTNSFKIPCRKCGIKSVYDLGKYLNISNAEPKFEIMFYLLKQYVLDGSKLDLSEFKEKDIAVYYEKDLGQIFFGEIIKTLTVRYVIDDIADNRYHPLWSGLSLSITQLKDSVDYKVDAVIILDVTDFANKKKNILNTNCCQQEKILSIYDVIMKIK